MLNLATVNKYNEFNLIIEDILNNETVCEMKKYRQHYDTNCYEHCYNVAFYSYLICKKFGLNYKAAARSGMLHDLFLYDWRKKQPDRKRFHGFRHPRIALNNSKKLFWLSPIEEDIILKHMWPITIIFPKHVESFIVSCVDKYCALLETKQHYRKTFNSKTSFRYTYVFLSLLIFRFF